MDEKDILALVTFFLLLLPYGLIWYVAFRSLRNYLKSALSYSVLISFSLIGVTAYYIVLFLTGNNLIKGKIGDLIAVVSFSTVMICYLLIIPAFVVTIILTIIYFATKKKKRQAGQHNASA